MKVLIVEPGKYPREADIEHTLEAEQAVVGGMILCQEKVQIKNDFFPSCQHT